MGLLRPDPETKELALTALHPGVTLEKAREATGWDLEVSDNLEETKPPTEKELRVLRDLHERTRAANSKTR